MNDKIQLAAMGEHMAEQAAQPMCMAKRIEELEAQVRVMAGLLREARPYIDHRGGAGVKGYTKLTRDIDAALAGKLPAPVVPEGWQLVPVTVTPEMFNASMKWDFWPIRPSNFQGLYDAMLAAAPSPDGTK